MTTKKNMQGTVLALLSLIVAARFDATAVRGQPRVLVLDHVRVIDGTGGAAQNDMRVTIRDDRIQSVGPGGVGEVPDGAERLDLAGRTLMPGLIDLHFHVENDPKLALRQLANGVTSFRDPGQWIEQYEPLRVLMAAEHLPGPRMALTGPHIDGANPAYPRIRTWRAIPRRRAVRRSGTSPTGPPPSRCTSDCHWPAHGPSSRCAARVMSHARPTSRFSTRARCCWPASTGSSTSRRSARASCRGGAPSRYPAEGAARQRRTTRRPL